MTDILLARVTSNAVMSDGTVVTRTATATSDRFNASRELRDRMWNDVEAQMRARVGEDHEIHTFISYELLELPDEAQPDDAPVEEPGVTTKLVTATVELRFHGNYISKDDTTDYADHWLSSGLDDRDDLRGWTISFGPVTEMPGDPLGLDS